MLLNSEGNGSHYGLGAGNFECLWLSGSLGVAVIQVKALDNEKRAHIDLAFRDALNWDDLCFQELLSGTVT